MTGVMHSRKMIGAINARADPEYRARRPRPQAQLEMHNPTALLAICAVYSPDAINLIICAKAGLGHRVRHPQLPAQHRVRSLRPAICAMPSLEATNPTTCAKADLRHAQNRRTSPLNLRARRVARAVRFLDVKNATCVQIGPEMELERNLSPAPRPASENADEGATFSVVAAAG